MLGRRAIGAEAWTATEPQKTLTLDQVTSLLPFYLVLSRTGDITEYSSNFADTIGCDIVDQNICRFFLINDLSLINQTLHDCSDHTLVLSYRIDPSQNFRFRVLELSDGETLLLAGIDQSAADSHKQRAPSQNIDQFEYVATNLQKDLVISDANGKIQWANHHFFDTTGYCLDEVKGKRLREVLFGNGSAFIEQNYVDKRILEGKPFSFETVAYRKNRSPYWFRATVHPIFNNEQDITGRFALLEDITDIREREQENIENQQLWKFASQMSGYAIWSYDFKANKFFGSEIFTHIFGRMAGGIRELGDIIATHDPVAGREFKQKIIPGLDRISESFSLEVKYIDIQGRQRFYLIRGRVVEFGEDDNPSKLFGTVSDISEIKLQELEIRNSRERLAVLVKNFDEGILFEKEDRTILLANARFCSLFHIAATPELLVGANAAEILKCTKTIFKDPEKFEEGVTVLLRERRVATEEIIELADGRILKRDFIPIYLDEHYSGHLWRYEDITDTFAIQQRIKDQKDYFSKILDALPVDLVILDKELRFQFVNKKAIKDPARREWVIGKANLDYCGNRNLPSEIGNMREECLSRAYTEKRTVQVIEEFPIAKGETQYILRVLYPYLDSDNELEFMIVYGIDISEQIKSRKYAEVQEARIRNLLYIINDGVFRCDSDGTLNLYNDSFLKIMQACPPDKNTKLNLFDLLPHSEHAELTRKIKLLSENGQNQTGTFCILTPDGSNKYIDYLITGAIRSEDAIFVGRISDVTAQVNKEQNLNEIIRKEKELNQSKSRFVRITSHELRNPLSIIRANAEILEMLLSQDIPKDKLIKPDVLFERINKGILQMTEILNRLLMLSKIEDGRMELDLANVCLASFINEIKNDFYCPYTDGRTLHLKIGAGSDEIRCDRNLLRHAIVNLVNNAFKYSFGKAEPILSIALFDHQVVIEMTDFGIGIPESDLPNLFTSFFRASNVGVIQGTGLGLVVLEFVVRKLSGSISVTSRENEGTVFTISLPRNLNNIALQNEIELEN